jgi:hypothetical protein
VLVRLGPTELDPDVRPIVLAAASTVVGDQPLETAIKQAIGQGADLVEVPAERLGAAPAPALRDSSLAVCVTCERLDEVDRVSTCGVAAVRWSGVLASVTEVRARLGSLPLVVFDGAEGPPLVRRPGDWWVVSWEQRERLTDRPAGVLGLVDLGARTDRAELAAAVTVALERGADGFVTVAPTSVRRAAHVIRAVERTR